MPLTDYIVRGAHAYQATSGPLSWVNASDAATAVGGYLVTITSATEQDFVHNNLQFGLTWIGATDIASEGDFTWVTGEFFGYTNFAPGEPDDDIAFGGNGDALYLSFEGAWADTNPNFTGFVESYVIEWNHTSQIASGSHRFIGQDNTNDTIRGGSGADTMSGELGNDVFEFTASNDVVAGESIDGGGDADRLSFVGAASTHDFTLASLLSIEEIAFAPISGVQSDLSFRSSQLSAGLASNLSVSGSSLSEVIRIFASVAVPNVNLSGWQFTSWNEGPSTDYILITGDTGADALIGSIQNDSLDGGLGTDSLTGGAGNDTYFADTFLDVIVENAAEGTDTIISTSSFLLSLAPNVENLTLAMGAGALGALGNDAANVIAGNDSSNGMAGGLGNDTIIGNGGDDAIDGQSGADSMVGGSGVDTYFVDDAGDVVLETEVGATLYDTVWTSLAAYTLPDNVEIYIGIGGAGAINGTGNDLITLMLGNEDANVLNSLGGNDIILGREGNDTINSGAGGNPAGYEVISGGIGNDSLTSGGGHDFFVYENINEAGDTITDFATGAGDNDDILEFRPMFFPTFTNLGGVTNVAQAVASGHLTYTQNGANVDVYADANGGGDNNVLMVTILNQTAANIQTYTLI